MSDMTEDYDVLDYLENRNKRKTMYKKNTAPLEKELIVVELSGTNAYGPYLKANGQFYGINEPLTDADFQKGEAYTILFKTGGKGKKYIAQIVSDSAGGSVASPAVPAASGVSKATPAMEADAKRRADSAAEAGKAKDTYAANETAKQKRILWQGVVQAVAQSPVYAGSDEATFVSSVEKNAEKLVAFINEKAV